MTLALGVALLAALAAAVIVPRLPDVVRELALPLAHEDIIRQQAGAKELDPSLLAAVIYAESRFRDATSHAGRARAHADHARDGALHRPPVGRHRVRAGRPRHAAGQHLLRRVLPALPAASATTSNTVLALAAYNGGEGNVDRWLAEASMSERAFGSEQIPFAETREYVDRVLDARTSYREKYSRELGPVAPRARPSGSRSA